MHRSIYKKDLPKFKSPFPPLQKRQKISNTPQTTNINNVNTSKDIININTDPNPNILERKCSWYTNLFGKNNQDCNFKLVLDFKKIVKVETSAGDLEFVLVKIPVGTEIYHSTVVSEKIGEEPWFVSKQPMNSTYGLAWFTSTEAHAGPILKNYILTYKVEEELTMIFEYNLFNYGNHKRGYEYSQNYLHSYINLLHKKGIEIDGYIGCNECEIAILNGSINEKISKFPVSVKKLGFTYID